MKGTPPSFRRFPDLNDGESDRAEIFTTDRTSKMIRHVFEEKVFLRVIKGFPETFWFFILPKKNPIRFCSFELKNFL
jgi:hypothetical protein